MPDSGAIAQAFRVRYGQRRGGESVDGWFRRRDKDQEVEFAFWMPFIDAARAEGYLSGKADGQRTGYADALRQHSLMEHEAPETYEDGVVAERERIRAAVLAEHLHENTGSDDDIAYDRAIDDAIEAIDALGDSNG